jgi:hypothetical protein
MTDNDKEMSSLKTFWLSFANENEFGGVVVVDVRKDEISAQRAFFAAIEKSIRLKINPGPDYDVHGHEIPPDVISQQFKHRLLSRAEVDLLNLRTQ